MIKVHVRPSCLLKYYIKQGLAKATYIYRHPFDVMVSALELGQQMRTRGEARRYFLIGPYRSFARFYTISDVIFWVKHQLYPRWKKGTSCDNILITKYESLVMNTYDEIERLSSHLGVSLAPDEINELIKKYTPNKNGSLEGDKWKRGRGPIFNKGIINRYKDILTPKELLICENNLKEILIDMKYQ